MTTPETHHGAVLDVVIATINDVHYHLRLHHRWPASSAATSPHPRRTKSPRRVRFARSSKPVVVEVLHWPCAKK